MKNRLISTAFVIAAMAGGVFVARYTGEQVAYAEQLVETCARESSAESCYEREVPLLFDELSVPQLFEVLRRIRAADPRYQFCHVLAHKIGEHAVAEDPHNWLRLVPLNPPDGLCSNGFIHGIIVGRFRDDVFDDETLKRTVPEFSRACEPQEGWEPSSLDQAICYHGMGHLFMFITDADYHRALDTCAAVAQSPSGDFTRVCREGVFMQTYQPLEPDDYDLIELLPEKPTKENYRHICAQFKDRDKGACLREAWPFFREDLLAGGMIPFCTGHPEDQIEACYETVFAIIGRNSQSSGMGDQIKTACGGAPEDLRGRCFGAVAMAFLEENRLAVVEASDVCSSATLEARDECFATLIDRMQFVFGSDTERASALCDALPASYRARCTIHIK